MKLLYISSVCTPKVLDFIFETSIIKPNQAVQKFHRLLFEGLALNKTICQVEVLSSLPVSPGGHKKIWWNLKEDYWKGVRFQYIPFLNFQIIKYVFVFFITFFKVIFWRFYNHKDERIIVCDILNVSIAWSTFIACKLTSQPIVAIITDLPVFLVSNTGKLTFLKRIYLKLASFVMHRFDYYIGLTQQMNEVVNPSNKPFLVMEGLVDSEISIEKNRVVLNNTKKILLYAGGIYEKYGIKNLIEAFMELKINDVVLHIYGSGDLENKMAEYCKLDERIFYFGLVSNFTIVEQLGKATLLINPLPTNEEFTKFSFPSKHMEYMVSGTPLLTTKLPGMPIEYNDFVYLFDDETVNGIKEKLEHLLSKPCDELNRLGNMGQKFVLNNKSNEIQAKRIIDFLKKQ